MKLVKKLLLLIFIVLFITCTAIVLNGYKLYSDAISEISLPDKISQLKSDKNYIEFNQLPADYVNAVISVEDKNFYKHGAISITSIGRAFITNIKEKEISEGGSTITQQSAKNLYFSQKQEFTRKVAEVFLSFDLEKNYSKNEIFEFYSNISYFGDGYYGIKEASLGYFSKEPKDLNLKECALLAGIPNAPSVYAPTQNPDLAKKRQNIVLERMFTNKYISEEIYKDAIKNE